MVKIKNIDYGVGFTVCEGNKPLYIELNKNLKGNLRKSVLLHEMQHWKSKSWIEDFKIDLLDCFNFKKQRELNRFCKLHKKANLCNSPFFIENGKLIPNYFLIAVYGLFLSSLITLGVILI